MDNREAQEENIELATRIEALPEYEQQRILQEEADRLLKQAGIDSRSGRHRSQLPRNYSNQNYFERRMLSGAYCSRRRK